MAFCNPMDPLGLYDPRWSERTPQEVPSESDEDVDDEDKDEFIPYIPRAADNRYSAPQAGEFTALDQSSG